jgi:hypothetical protein
MGTYCVVELTSVLVAEMGNKNRDNFVISGKAALRYKAITYLRR